MLVIGGTGFIGHHLLKTAKNKCWQTTSVSLNSPTEERFVDGVRYLHFDMTDCDLVKKYLDEDFDYVVNLGGYVDHSDKKKTFKSHYEGCKNLAEIFLKKKPTAFIQMGTSVEYGKIKSPQKENAKCSPKSIKSIYGKAKLLSSIYLINLFKKNKFPSTILRLYLTYGPRQDINRLIPIIIEGCVKNKKFDCSEGNQFRDFVHVDDVVDAILKS